MLAIWVLWIIAAIAFGIIEMFSTTFFMVWFAIGSLAASVASLFGADTYTQYFVFLLTSAIMLIFTRPIIKKIFHSKAAHKTNIDSMPGQKGIVTAEINPLLHKGQVKINNEVWTATSASQTIIEKDSVVSVLEIKGVTAIVEKTN